MCVTKMKVGKMNNIQNYSNASVNYDQASKSTNFKGFIITEAAKNELKASAKIINEQAGIQRIAGLAREMLIERLICIKRIKSFAENSKFYDLVLYLNGHNDLSFGIKKCWQDLSEMVSQHFIKVEGDKIVSASNNSTVVGKLKDEAIAKSFSERRFTDDNVFMDLFKALEENAQNRAKEAEETLKELVGKEVTI